MSFFDPFSPGASPIGSPAITPSQDPPANISDFWYRKDDGPYSRANGLYFHDGDDWVTMQVFEIAFNKSGNLNNGQPSKFGDTTCALSPVEGPVYNEKVKIFQVTISENNNTSGVLLIYSETSPSTPIGSINFNTGQSKLSFPSNPIVVDGLKTINFTPNSMPNRMNDPKVIFEMRKVYVP